MYNSEMSTRAVRDLKTTKVVLVLLRAIRPHDALRFAVSVSYHLGSMFLPSFRAVGAGGEGARPSE